MLPCSPGKLCLFTLPPAPNVKMSAHFLSILWDFHKNTLCNPIAPLPSCVLPLRVFWGERTFIPLRVFWGERTFWSLGYLKCCSCISLKTFTAAWLFLCLLWDRMEFPHFDHLYFWTQLRSCFCCKASSDTPGWFRRLSSVLPVSKHGTACSAVSSPDVSSLRVEMCFFFYFILFFLLYLQCLMMHVADVDLE